MGSSAPVIAIVDQPANADSLPLSLHLGTTALLGDLPPSFPLLGLAPKSDAQFLKSAGQLRKDVVKFRFDRRVGIITRFLRNPMSARICDPQGKFSRWNLLVGPPSHGRGKASFSFFLVCKFVPYLTDTLIEPNRKPFSFVRDQHVLNALHDQLVTLLFERLEQGA